MQRHTVAIALLYVGALVLVSRGWLGNIRNYVDQVTGHAPASSTTTSGPVAGLIPSIPAPDEKTVVGQFAVGYAILWLVLTAGSESDATADLSVALALTIALSASFLYVPKAGANLGLIKAA